MREAGLQTRVDAVGNVIGRLESSHEATLLVGSHLDTVRDAGRYDGPLGVLAGIALAERLAGASLPFSLEVLAFADEEGLRYGTPYLGSRVVAGSFRLEDLDRRDEDGISMRDAIRDAGGAPDAIPGEARSAETLLGYVELHIEQGPLLESLDRHVGVVSAIAGRTRARLELNGAAGHAGTVPMALRRDPLVAAARIVERVDAIARASEDLVATVGELSVEPGAANVIPGRVTLSIDLRSPDDGSRLEAWESLAADAGLPRDPGRRGAATARARAHCRGRLRSSPPGAAEGSRRGARRRCALARQRRRPRRRDPRRGDPGRDAVRAARPAA